LYTDTNGLTELRHPLDRDLAEQPYSEGFIRLLKSAAITMDELDILTRSLQNREVIGGIGIFRAERCDSNLLGFAGDIAQQVVGVDCCVIYCVQEYGVKLSVRSGVRQVAANELAQFVCREVGSGGGSVEKAGGFMGPAELGNRDVHAYLRERVALYNRYYDSIQDDMGLPFFAGMAKYRQRALPRGFVRLSDIYPVGTRVTLRTRDRDTAYTVEGDTLLLIDEKGDVQPISKANFDVEYTPRDDAYYPDSDYAPVIVNQMTHERSPLFAYTRTCLPTGEKHVRAMELSRAVKLFSRREPDKYVTAEPGDWVVAGDNKDSIIVGGSRFWEMYEDEGGYNSL
jgi:phosphoglycolate phosphatase